jgi:hypothetical protein
MIVIDNFTDGSFVPIFYDRKHINTYLVQQFRSAMALDLLMDFEVNFDSHYELEVPKGIRIHKDLKKFFKVVSGEGYRLISIKGITLQISQEKVDLGLVIMWKDVISLPRGIEKKLLLLMEKCSIRSQE